MVRLALAVALLLAASASARAGMTARRLFLLCEMESPKCGPALCAAELAYFANPTWTSCVMGAGRQSRECPASFGRVTVSCRPITRMPVRQLYSRFMEVMAMDMNVFGELPSRLGVYDAYRSVGACQ